MKKIIGLIVILLMINIALPTIADDLSAPDDVAAIPQDAIMSESGLGSRVLVKGTGTQFPKPFSRVKVHYTGWTTDGKLFDSSVKRGKAITFPLNQVIDGWREGLTLMVVGEKRRLWIPQNMAYNGKANAPKGMLVFDVELIEIPKQEIKFQ